LAVTTETLAVLTKGSTEVFGSEREFREKVVSRLLESLGWNSTGDIQYEVPIQAGTDSLKIDYVVGSDSKFALETKKPGINISPGSSAWLQIVSFLRLDPTLLYGVLYNGKELHILDSHGQEPLVSWYPGKNTAILDLLKKEYFPVLLQHYSMSNISGNISSEDYSSITSPVIAEIDENNRQMREDRIIAENLQKKMHRHLWYIPVYVVFVVIAAEIGPGSVGIPLLTPLVVILPLGIILFPIIVLYYELKLKAVKKRLRPH